MATISPTIAAQRVRAIACLKQKGCHKDAQGLVESFKTQPVDRSRGPMEKPRYLPVVKADLTRNTGGCKGSPGGCGQPASEPRLGWEVTLAPVLPENRFGLMDLVHRPHKALGGQTASGYLHKQVQG